MVEKNQADIQLGSEQDLEQEVQRNQVMIEQKNQQRLLEESGQVQVVPQIHPGHSQVIPKVSSPPVDWKQPEAESLADACLKWFKDYLQVATNDKMSDDAFGESLKHYLGLTFDGHCDESFSKLAAMHKYPSKIINKEDIEFVKESAYFIKHIIKPTEQRGTVLGSLAHKGVLSFHRDHPDLQKLTERFAAMCIHIHGVTLVKEHAAKFVNKLVGFCEEFTARTASMPSKWDTPSFRDLNSLLRLASGSGDYCPRGCGKIHADLFTQDECKFEQNKLSEPEKQELTKHKEKCDEAKKQKIDAPPAPEWKLTEVY